VSDRQKQPRRQRMAPLWACRFNRVSRHVQWSITALDEYLLKNRQTNLLLPYAAFNNPKYRSNMGARPLQAPMESERQFSCGCSGWLVRVLPS